MTEKERHDIGLLKAQIEIINEHMRHFLRELAALRRDIEAIKKKIEA